MGLRIFSVAILLTSVFSSAAYAEAEAVFLLSGGESTFERGSFSGTGTTLKIGSGFRVTESSGIEIFWSNYGEMKDTVNLPGLGNSEMIAEANSLAFQYAHFFPMADSFDLLARLGFAFWKSEIGVAGSTKFNDDGINLILGVGAEVKVLEDWSLRVEWEYTEFRNYEVSFLSAGIAHYFE